MDPLQEEKNYYISELIRLIHSLWQLNFCSVFGICLTLQSVKKMLLTLQPPKNAVFKTYIVLILNTEIMKGLRIYDKSKDQVIFNIAFSYKS